MSLINDALKRTKDVQQQTPPAADGPALRPVDPAQAKAASSARTFLFVMVAAVVIGNFLIWLALHEKPKEKGPQPVITTTEPAPAAAAAVAPAAAIPAATNTPEATVVAVQAPPAVTPSAPPTATSSAPAVVFADPPKPTVLRLQSIIYGTRPSAMIAGKFLFVGESIQGHKVIAIDKETVTLIGNGQTNVLSLP
jgi:hypothetical protein